MRCVRCEAEMPTPGKPWCADCERAYDTWSRQHAADIITPVVTGGALVSLIAMGLPLLGAGVLVAASGIFVGFGAILGMYRLKKRQRRHQFLRGDAMPRAYLPDKGSGTTT